MNIFDYIDEYGIYTFEEEKINLIDVVIFSFLSYINFDKIVTKNKIITLQDVGRMHLGLHSKDEKNIIAIREANKLLRYLCDTNRYKNCLVSNYKYIGKEEIQFGAITFEYSKNKVYVSFEGTDQLISGWIEDLILSYKFPTISHLKAIDYLNHNFTFSRKEIIVGGHSKGGNLALVASMYANPIVKRKIKKIYNVDGPGLLDKQFYSLKYKRIINKYLHIIPDQSIVGMCLNSSNEYVVKSTVKGPLAHDILFWKINKNKFVEEKLSLFSTELRYNLLKWVREHNLKESEILVNNIYNIFKRANITSLIELKDNKSKILKLINEANELDSESKKTIHKFISIIIKTFGDSKIEDLKNKITNMIENR